MARSKRKVVAICVFLLAFSTGVGVVLLKGWAHLRPPSALYISKIIENSQQPFTSHVSDLKTDESLDFIQFLNANVGWTGNHKGTLYWTNDGGKRWERIESKLEGYVSSICLSSDSAGWVILRRYGRDSDKTEQEASVLYTNDRGRNWQVQFSAKSLELVRMSFASPNEGWVIGTRFFKQRDALRSEFFLLHTTDAGSNWIDLSSEPNKAMADFSGRVGESPTDIVATKPGALTVLTENGWTISTTDSGVRWQSFGRPATEGLDAQRLVPATVHEFPRVLAGMGGNHGIASMLALRQNDGSWTSRGLSRVFVKDALYVSDKELLACGSMLSANNQPLELSGEGVVLHSPDDGLNWTIVYRSPDVRSLSALGRSDAGHIWAVGSNGTIVGLERR